MMMVPKSSHISDLMDWIEFFEAAGLPPTVHKAYAQIFLDNRIGASIMTDLDKDHLRDMGITIVGDVIAILKQCKKFGLEVNCIFVWL